LVKPGISIITPNPKTSGSARWNILAHGDSSIRAPARTKRKPGILSGASTKAFPVLDSGARGATTTFVERGIGDVLVNRENEILLGARELGPDKFDIPLPAFSRSRR
jgi:sulfate/thiosulfate transport system substrate-binding protein